jgi:hypothetical protein
MYKTEAWCQQWTHAAPYDPTIPNAKFQDRGSKRKTVIGTGVFVLDHVSTGKYIVSASKNVSLDVDREITKLKAGNHPNKALQRQFNWDQTFACIEYPASNMKEAKRIEAEIRSTNDTPYCLLN